MKVPKLTHIYAVIRDFKRPKLIKVTEYFVEQYLLIVQLNMSCSVTWFDVFCKDFECVVKFIKKLYSFESEVIEENVKRSKIVGAPETVRQQKASRNLNL